MRGKPLKLKLLENGCVIPTTHKLFLMCRSLPLVGGLESGKCRDYP